MGIGEGADLIVLADEVQLEHALGNVVDNALRYGAGPVRKSAIERPAVVELHVTDEGPGIPDVFLPRAFDRFSRADPGRDDGSGLGLAIVQMIARAHDGTASVRNRPTGGADVVVSIPSHTDSPGVAPIDMSSSRRRLHRDGLGTLGTYPSRPGEEILLGAGRRFMVIDVAPVGDEHESAFVEMPKTDAI